MQRSPATAGQWPAPRVFVQRPLRERALVGARLRARCSGGRHRFQRDLLPSRSPRVPPLRQCMGLDERGCRNVHAPKLSRTARPVIARAQAPGSRCPWRAPAFSLCHPDRGGRPVTAKPTGRSRKVAEEGSERGPRHCEYSPYPPSQRVGGRSNIEYRPGRESSPRS